MCVYVQFCAGARGVQEKAVEFQSCTHRRLWATSHVLGINFVFWNK